MKHAVCFLLLTVLALCAADVNIAGRWSGSFTPENGDGGNALMVLKQDGDTITGTGGPDESRQWPVQSGKMVGNKATMEVTEPGGPKYSLTLTLKGEHLIGDVVVTSPEGQTSKATLDLTRVK